MKVTSFSIQTSPMTSIDFGTLLTTIFVIVDDWYQKQVKKKTYIMYILCKDSGNRVLTKGTLEGEY
ncbi:MAG: hypothetical protein RMX96_31060, partial [Nostoc sp. ChiSLP02]|nr:hypothetical protein [Nostoc sp. ChiSLP02]